MSNSSVCSILDLPDEILVNIILHFNARERLALGNSCQRFNNLVFGDEKLLRNLDFTLEQQPAVELDIQQYFDDENTCQKILGMNIEYVWAVRNLSSSIGKAINLVDLNILSESYFDSVEELSCLLKPLVHLKRLSAGWLGPDVVPNYDNPNRNQVLQEPFSRLTYLSLNIYRQANEFLLALQFCQQLVELRVSILGTVSGYAGLLLPEPMKLSNLRSVRLIGWAQDSWGLGGHIMRIVADPAEWTHFWTDLAYPHDEVYLDTRPYGSKFNQVERMRVTPFWSLALDIMIHDEITWFNIRNFHLINGYGSSDFPSVGRRLIDYFPERNVEVCAKLSQVKEMPPPRYVEHRRITGSINTGWPLVFEHLLSEVIRITHQDAPKKFCCLSPTIYSRRQPCLPNIDEAKQLLKDPGYQISCLNLSHEIHKNCDVHLLASAFPNLTKLVLTRTSNKNPPEMTKPLRRRLRRKGSLASKEDSHARNTDSSFKMLVENTPRLKVLEISGERGDDDVEYWDFAALYLISGWKDLTVLRLYDIPIRDGRFLIDIGKECKKLEEVALHYLGLVIDCSYESELLQMLQHCENLRKLSTRFISLKHLSEIFNILSNCSRLKDFDLETITVECDPRELTSSVEEMLRQCHELKRFSLYLHDYQLCDELRCHVQKIISELNRLDFEFDLD